MIQAASLADASTPAWREPLAQFQAFTIAHPHLVAAKDSLIAAIRESEPNSIVMVFGPTGVGKTTLDAHRTDSDAGTADGTGSQPIAHSGSKRRSHRAGFRQLLLAQLLQKTAE